MKNMLSGLLLLIASATYAQDKLVLVTGDTLTGDIEILLPSSSFEEISFENESEKERYKAHQFVEFTEDGKNYRTVKFGEKYRIMLVEMDGYLSLLRYRADESYTFNSQFLKKLGGEGSEIPTFLFKKAMANYLKDCAPVQEGIEKGDFKKKNIEELVTAYNNCMDNQTENRFAQRRPEPATKEAFNSPLIDEVRNLIKEAEKIPDEELENMLTDVADKLESGQPVPGYLKNALSGHVSEGHSMKDAVMVLLKEL